VEAYAVDVNASRALEAGAYHSSWPFIIIIIIIIITHLCTP
jgi:hypothetical protein